MKVTVEPPAARLLPAASFACRRRVAVVPDATVEPPPTMLTTDVAKEIVPGLTVIEVVDVTAEALIVAPMVAAVPETLPVIDVV